jgi:tRNA threonylcarbamoyladenosine biosynthesis protein TsaB
MGDMHESWKRLAIDTATKYVYLSLIIDDHEVDFVYEEGLNNHSVTVIPQLESLLDRQGLKLKDIDEVICGIGPGSYTGVRIGVTIAKMIGHLNNVRLMSVSSLALIASSVASGMTLSLIDARRGNAFMGLFENIDGRLSRSDDDILENVEKYRSKITNQVIVVTEGRPNIEKIINSNLLEPIIDAANLVPNYLQITEAERNKCQR